MEIAEAVEKMNEQNMFIDSVQHVQQVLKQEYGIDAKAKDVGHVMRDDLQMRYRKVVGVSIHSNSAKNIVLRQ